MGSTPRPRAQLQQRQMGTTTILLLSSSFPVKIHNCHPGQYLKSSHPKRRPLLQVLLKLQRTIPWRSRQYLFKKLTPHQKRKCQEPLHRDFQTPEAANEEVLVAATKELSVTPQIGEHLTSC